MIHSLWLVKINLINHGAGAGREIVQRMMRWKQEMYLQRGRYQIFEFLIGASVSKLSLGW